MPKRSNYISWDEYFMGVALLSAKRSKDPSTQIGCCIVSPDNIIVSVGYNGFPKNCSDDEYPWEKQGESFMDIKYPYVVHAELNAILNAGGRSLKNCKLYCSMYPCNECAKAIIQSGIKEVYYLSDKYAELDIYKISKRMLASAKIKTIQMESEIKSIVINYNADEI